MADGAIFKVQRVKIARWLICRVGCPKIADGLILKVRRPEIAEDLIFRMGMEF